MNLHLSNGLYIHLKSKKKPQINLMITGSN